MITIKLIHPDITCSMLKCSYLHLGTLSRFNMYSNHIYGFVPMDQPMSETMTYDAACATNYRNMIVYCINLSRLTEPIETSKNFDLMISGELYDSNVPSLIKLRKYAKTYCQLYNSCKPNFVEYKKFLLGKLFDAGNACIEPNFWLDYPFNFKVGKNFYSNHNLIVLNCGLVEIGDDCLIGPGVIISAATHPLESAQRIKGLEFGPSIKIGKNVWIGARSTILGPVVIGDNVVVGANSFVNKNLESNGVYIGSPAKRCKEIN